MAIDLRAYVYCSLGPLVSADLADDYVQDSGLIRCRGSAVINDIITPDVGSIVDLGYAKNGRLARIPRRMRVLSSSANPYTGLTTVELGCLLTYLQDLQKPDERVLKSINDPYGIIDVPEERRSYTPPYISARYVFENCLTKLGITSTGAVLTNKFITEDFDISRPYVEIISDLLKSECQFGYLDVNDVLRVKSLNDAETEGPLYDDDSIVEIESIGVGELPGESVFVPFASRRLKPPEDNPDENAIKRINWERTENSTPTTIYIRSKTATRVYDVLQYTRETTTYKTIPVYRKAKTIVKGLNRKGQIIDYEVDSYVYERAEDKEVRESSETYTELPVVEVLGALAVAKLEYGEAFPNYPVIQRQITNYYYDDEGNEVQTISEKYESESALIGKSNVIVKFPAAATPGNPNDKYIDPPGTEATILTERTITTTDNSAGYSRTVTITFVHYIATQEGQQTIAAGAQTIRTKAEAQEFISEMLKSGIVLQDSNTEVRRTGENTAQARPNQAERVAAETTKTFKETIDGLTVEIPSVVLVYGSVTSQRFIELTMPYVPDDYVVVTGTGPSATAYVVRSDARQKAINFGIIQNRLRLANRAGVNIKVAPEVVPVEPYAPCYIKAAGTMGHFRINGCTWTMSASGIACGIDLLYWGAVGQDPGGKNWLPVAPGIATLPTTPPIVIGTSPIPPMSTDIPVGFDLQNPDLEELFDTILPTTGDPVYPASSSPTVTIPPYNLILPYVCRISLTPVARITPPANVLEPAVAGISIYNSYQTDDDAVLLLNFEGTAGSKVIIDSSINQYEPSLVKGVASLATGGKTGQSFYSVPSDDWSTFDNGAGSVIEYSDPVFSPGIGDFTIECWIKLPERRPPNDESGDYTIFSSSYQDAFPFNNRAFAMFELYDNQPESATADWSLEFRASSTEYGSVYQSISLYPYINGIFTLNEWHHVAVVRSEDKLSLYMNGELLAFEESIQTVNISKWTTSQEVKVSIANFYEEYLHYSDGFNGGIDGFGMYHRAKYIEPFIPDTRLFRTPSGPAIAPQLFLESTSYEIDGSADLIKTGILPSDGTSLTLTVQDADIERLPHRLEADGAQFATASEDVALIPVLLIASDGSFALTGSDAGPIDPHFYRVSALLKMEGLNNSTTFLDDSSNNLTITVNGNAKITTTSPKFGNSCATFDGTGDYLSMASSQLFDVGGIPFTVECWIKPTNTTQTSRPIFGQRITSAFAPFEIRVNGTGMSWLIANASITAWSSTASSVTGLLVAGNWHHIAFVGTGSNLTLYVNGTSRLTLAQPVWVNANRQMFIGLGGQSNGLVGEIDEFRFTKFFARYTANFTPPPQEFPDS